MQFFNRTLLAPYAKAIAAYEAGKVSIAEDYKTQGIGSKLLNELILQSEAAGYWTLEAFIFPENEASIALHKKHNYELIGTRNKIGVTHDGVFRDVMLFERRSGVVGKS